MDGTKPMATLAVGPTAGFVETPQVRSLAERALRYLAAGYPVHFAGPSGSGKTTLALHVAHRLGQPVALLCGDDEFGTSDLVGSNRGFRRRKVIDNFIHSVLKLEEDVSQQWVDQRLAAACHEGWTLVYDEFTRSRPEANNVLLSVLEERILVLPASWENPLGYTKVHPEFRMIFTSNPEDYAGVHSSQDALRDRMVAIHTGHFDFPTEVAITRARSGASTPDAQRIVRLVRALRETVPPASANLSVRNCIMIARVLSQRGAAAVAGDALFELTCQDVLASRVGGNGRFGENGAGAQELVAQLLAEHCAATRSRKPAVRAAVPGKSRSRPATKGGRSDAESSELA